MMRKLSIVLLLFITHEAFYFLPQKLVIIPGVFRISDAFFVILPFFAFSIFRTFSRYREESLMVISFCALMILSCVMGSFNFNQTYVEGLLNIRRTFFWLSFFVFATLIRNTKDAEKLINLLTFLAFGYVIILILTKYFPGMGIINYADTGKVWYKESYISGSQVRFGEHRLFFPYPSIPILLYCIALAKLTSGNKIDSLPRKIYLVAFMIVTGYAILSSYTRSVIYSWLVATTFAFIVSGRRAIRVIATISIALFVFAYALSVATTDSPPSFLTESKLGKIILKSGELEPEIGRMFQAKMYLRRFMNSPVVGIGSFSLGKYAKFGYESNSRAYREHGFFAGSDLGYLKILGENGLLGIGWVVWWYSYIYRRRRQILAEAKLTGNAGFADVFCKGMFYFTLYILISGLTLPHWVHPEWITILPLALALMAITRVMGYGNVPTSAKPILQQTRE